MPRSSVPSSPSLVLRPEPSRWLLRGLATAHLLAGLAALANSLPWTFRCLILLCVVWSFIRERRAVLWPEVESVVLGPGEGACEIGHRGIAESVCVQDGSLVSRYLVILRLRTESGRRIDLPVVRDSMDEETHRRLRVYLRCGEWRSKAG